jgi:hypothetical protein
VPQLIHGFSWLPVFPWVERNHRAEARYTFPPNHPYSKHVGKKRKYYVDKYLKDFWVAYESPLALSSFLCKHGIDVSEKRLKRLTNREVKVEYAEYAALKKIHQEIAFDGFGWEHRFGRRSTKR